MIKKWMEFINESLYNNVGLIERIFETSEEDIKDYLTELEDVGCNIKVEFGFIDQSTMDKNISKNLYFYESENIEDYNPYGLIHIIITSSDNNNKSGDLTNCLKSCIHRINYNLKNKYKVIYQEENGGNGMSFHKLDIDRVRIVNGESIYLLGDEKKYKKKNIQDFINDSNSDELDFLGELYITMYREINLTDKDIFDFYKFNLSGVEFVENKAIITIGKDSIGKLMDACDFTANPIDVMIADRYSIECLLKTELNAKLIKIKMGEDSVNYVKFYFNISWIQEISNSYNDISEGDSMHNLIIKYIDSKKSIKGH